MTTTVVNNSVFRTFFGKEKLTGANFIDWFHNIKIVLSVEDKLTYLEHLILVAPVPAFGQEIPLDVLAAHTTWVNASKEIIGLILMNMVPELQKNLKQLRGQYVSSYILKMDIYIDNLERLGHPMSLNLVVSLILVSLFKEYHSFMQNYNMHSMGKNVSELHAMLKLHEQTLPKKDAAHALHEIRAGRIQKNNHKNKKLQISAKGNNQGKGKTKLAYAPTYALKPKIPPPPKKDNPTKDAICHQYGEGLRGSNKLKPGALNLYVGNGHRATVEATGTFHLYLPSRLVVILNNCHYAPSFPREIISVSPLKDNGFVNFFIDNGISVSKDGLLYFHVIPHDGIYEIDLHCAYSNDSFIYAVSNKRAKLNLDSTLLWHCRLEHISKKQIEKLQHDGILKSTDLEYFDKCITCLSGKMARKPYSHQVERAKDLLGLIHTDVCGPFRTVSRQGAMFQKEVENQLDKTIKSLRFDRRGEYMSQAFLDHLKEHGIISHRTSPYTLQHNGVFEMRNRTLLDMVRSMMSQTTLPKSFWDYALESAARMLNMVPTKKVKKTLYEVWHGQAPKMSYLKVWGCENSLITQEASGSLEDLEIIQYEDTHPFENTSLHHDEDNQEIDEPQSDIIPICSSTRTRHAPYRMCLYVDAEEHELGDLNEPANYKAALLDPESDKCLAAINVEIQSMKDNQLWELVDLPPNGKTVGSKWIFKKKTDMDGNVHIYKACLVAKGFTQTYGVDYEETFSPVVDIRGIGILIAITAFYDYEIWQINFKTAFLDGHLSEEVYMVQREGFVNLKHPNQVCKLKRSIYGLKQASRQWNKRFDDEIKEFSFTQNRDEPCVYMKPSGSNVTFLIMEVAYVLGIKIYKDRLRRLIGMCQSAYIKKILKRFNMENSKRGSIPMQDKSKLSKSQGASTPAEVKRIGDIKRELRVACYTDVGYLTDVDDSKSQTGYIFVLNGGVVVWKSTKQSILATSSAEAEYIVASDTSKEVVSIRKFIFGLGVVSTNEVPMKMYCDNTRAITIANEPGITKGARHYRTKVYYLCEVIELGDTVLEKVHTYDNVADHFTKVLPFNKHSEHTKSIDHLTIKGGIRVVVDSLQGEVIGAMGCGKWGGVSCECTREVVWARNRGGEGFEVLAPRGEGYEVGFVCTMAEIGCNWARIGPSKSSQSLSNAHKWAVVND
ncbi:retrotransposon protein, putative, ty1-copia subclass [Tanacetum coccineum]